jgi:hypothetical protein
VANGTFSLGGLELVAASVKCPKGHWFDPSAFGASDACPVCARQASSESRGKQFSEDDVLAMLDSPEQSVSGSSSNLHKDSHSSSSLHLNKKVCPTCGYKTSPSFGYCPRCGDALKTATLDI